MQASTSIQLALEADNSYEAGSTLRGKVNLIRRPSLALCSNLQLLPQPPMPLPGGGAPDGNRVDGDQCDGTVVISLEGFERTKIVFNGGGVHVTPFSLTYMNVGYRRRMPVVYRDERRIVYEEKKYTLSTDNQTCSVAFSLDLPHDLPGCLAIKRFSFDASDNGECSIMYRLTAKWNLGVDCKSACLSSCKVVEITKKRCMENHAVLPLAVSSMLEIPNFVCGFYRISTTKTFSLNIDDSSIQLLNLSPNQKLSLLLQDKENLGLTGDWGPKKLMAKLTQKSQLFAKKNYGQKVESPVHIQCWNLAVTTTAPGSVSISFDSRQMPSLNMSYHGKLIQFRHELIIYVVDSQSKSILATSQPIPVIMSPCGGTT